MRILPAVLFILLAGAPLPAQQWTPTHGFWDRDRCFTCSDKAMHAGAGAALDLLVRGPWITRSYRDRAWKRVLWVAVVGASYELTDAQRKVSGGRVGFGAIDLVADVAGAVVVELLDRVLR